MSSQEIAKVLLSDCYGVTRWLLRYSRWLFGGYDIQGGVKVLLGCYYTIPGVSRVLQMVATVFQVVARVLPCGCYVIPGGCKGVDHNKRMAETSHHCKFNQSYLVAFHMQVYFNF